MSRLGIKTRVLTDSEKDYRGVDQLVKLLESAAWVESPDGGSRITVNVGSTQPGPDDRNAPWFKTSSDGSSLGIYATDSSGQFVQIAGWITNELKRIVNFNSDSGVLPSGWQLADGTNGTEDYSSEFVGAAPSYDLVVIQYVG